MRVRALKDAAVLLLVAALACRTASAQATAVLRITVTIADADGNVIPIPRARLLISDNPTTRGPRSVRTGADGTVEISLPPGNYTVESDVPVTMGGRTFTWTEMLDVAAGQTTTLALTAVNAAVETATGATSDPATATSADGASILHRWRRSIVEIWTPVRHATGFLVDARGLIATNDHAIGEAGDVEVEFADGAERVKVRGRVAATDRTKGVTIIWIDPEAVRGRLPITPACGAEPRPPVAHDDKVVALIAPILEAQAAVPGTAMRPDAQSFRVDWQLDSASSGGPVFAADGAPIGITVGQDEEQRPGRRVESYVVPLSNACSVLAAAERAIAGATPPDSTPLRTEAGLPRISTARPSEPKTSRLQPPVIRAGDFDIALLTPAMVTRDQTTWSTRSYFGYWMPYVANAPQTLLVRATPQFEESFWKMLARGAASTQGVSLPPMPSFNANFLRMRAFCGDAEVMPIHGFRVEMPVDRGGVLREGLYVFALTDFGSHCASVRFDLFSEKSPNKADSKTIDPAIIAKVIESSR